MKAQKILQTLQRHSLISLAIVLLSSIVALSGLASSTAQSPTKSDEDIKKNLKEDIEKEFNDDDLKVKEEKVRGKWGTGLAFDMSQFNRKEFPVSLLRGCRYGIPKGTAFPLVKGGVNTPTAKSACGATERRRRKFIDSSLPVVVSGMQSLSGGGKYLGITKIKRVKVTNRTPRIVNSVQLRWKIVNPDDPEKVLSEGTTSFVNIWLEANSSQIIEIPTLYPTRIFKPLAKNGELYGQFLTTIGMQEARFADGSFWQR